MHTHLFTAEIELGQASGIEVYGEQRACALADHDEDGRVDLVVTQNAAQTKLFRNVTAKPGLRIRLAGVKSNPDGVGGVLRLPGIPRDQEV